VCGIYMHRLICIEYVYLHCIHIVLYTHILHNTYCVHMKIHNTVYTILYPRGLQVAHRGPPITVKEGGRVGREGGRGGGRLNERAD